MDYRRSEITMWVYSRLPEMRQNTFYGAAKWNKECNDTNLDHLSLDLDKFALVIFNKYHIQVEPAALKKFTVTQLINYISINVKSEDWIINAVSMDHGLMGHASWYYVPIVSERGITSTEWEELIFQKMKVHIPAQYIEKMDVGDLVFLYRMIETLNLIPYITFGIKYQPKKDIYIEENLAADAIDNVRKRERFLIRSFIIALISFLMPIYFLGPNIIKSGIVFSSTFEWILGIICWLGTLIGIGLVVLKFRPFNRCWIAFSEEMERLLSHYTLMLFFVLTSSMSLYASQSINLSKVADENISLSSYSIVQSNSEEEIIRDNLKVIIPIDDENRVTAILIVLAVAIAFNIAVCTIFRKIVKKFTKMEMDGVILERNGNPYDMLWHWDRESIWFDKNEKRRVMAIKIKVTKQLFFYHVLFTILILSTAYFAIIRPIIEIGK